MGSCRFWSSFQRFFAETPPAIPLRTFLVTGVKNDFIAGRLVGELPDDVRRLMLRAKFAFDLAATAEFFPERKLLYKAFDYLTLPLAPAIHQAAESLRIGLPDAEGVVSPSSNAPGIINTAKMI